MNDNIQYIRKHLKKKLDEDRYEHTIGVAYTAICLAMRYGVDLNKAETAGLLHDCAKCIPDPIKLDKCRSANITITKTEEQNPSLLHAKLGAYIAMNKYKINDMDVINAILNHTTGKPAMTMLEEIIFVADYIEPRRDKAANLAFVRKLAFIDLDRAVFEIMNQTLTYLKAKKANIDDTTKKACNYYKNLCNEKEHAKERG